MNEIKVYQKVVASPPARQHVKQGPKCHPDLKQEEEATLKWVTASGWRRRVQVRMKQEAVYNCQAVVIPAKMSRERTVDSPPDKRPRFTARERV